MEPLLPKQSPYVCGDYLTISDTSTGDGSFSLSLGEDELSSLTELLGGGGGSALTPDGNLTLIDDYGSTTGTGKQFITLETKAGYETTGHRVSSGAQGVSDVPGWPCPVRSRENG